MFVSSSTIIIFCFSAIFHVLFCLSLLLCYFLYCIICFTLLFSLLHNLLYYFLYCIICFTSLFSLLYNLLYFTSLPSFDSSASHFFTYFVSWQRIFLLTLFPGSALFYLLYFLAVHFFLTLFLGSALFYLLCFLAVHFFLTLFPGSAFCLCFLLIKLCI